MNRDRHRYWSAYIADVQRRMLLADWRIELDWVPPLVEGRAGEVSPSYGMKHAVVRLDDDFDDVSRREQRRVVVHELVHVHLAPLFFHLRLQCGDDDSSKLERSRIEVGHSSHEEYAVDDLARIIAPSMPLPPKVAKP